MTRFLGDVIVVIGSDCVGKAVEAGDDGSELEGGKEFFGGELVDDLANLFLEGSSGVPEPRLAILIMVK